MHINYVDYEQKLSREISAQPHLVTECLIRHWFTDVHGKNVEIEVPYVRVDKSGKSITPIHIKPKYNGCLASNKVRADLCADICPPEAELYGRKAEAVIEFKYHRATKYSRNCTTTKLGSLFADMNRLSIVDADDKYLIYVFDDDMRKYFGSNRKENKQARECFDLNSISINSTRKITSTTVSSCGKEFPRVAMSDFDLKKLSASSGLNYTITAKYAKDIPRTNLYMIIYQIA